MYLGGRFAYGDLLIFSLRRARCLEHVRRYRDAMSVYDDLVSRAPDSPAALSGRARCLYLTGNWLDARPLLEELLAAEDLEFRRQNDGRVLERLFNVNVYYEAYESQSLDKYFELQRLRNAGIRTPAAPPNPELLDQ